MEVVDELMTPGCPNCALKHLSAAVSLYADNTLSMKFPKDTNYLFGECQIRIARAYINLIEAIEGYESHFDFAVGLLVRAEEFAILEGEVEFAKVIRENRVVLMVYDRDTHALAQLRSMSYCMMAVAHILEARRELPSECEHILCDDTTTVSSLQASIKWIKERYFDAPAMGDGEEKGGEEDMKKVAKKAEKVVAKPAKKDAKKCVGKCKK